MKRKQAQAGEGPEGGKCGEGHNLRGGAGLPDMVRVILLGTGASIYKVNWKNGPTTQVTGMINIIIQLSKNCFTIFLPPQYRITKPTYNISQDSAQRWTI